MSSEVFFCFCFFLLKAVVPAEAPKPPLRLGWSTFKKHFYWTRKCTWNQTGFILFFLHFMCNELSCGNFNSTQETVCVWINLSQLPGSCKWTVAAFLGVTINSLTFPYKENTLLRYNFTQCQQSGSYPLSRPFWFLHRSGSLWRFALISHGVFSESVRSWRWTLVSSQSHLQTGGQSGFAGLVSESERFDLGQMICKCN